MAEKIKLLCSGIEVRPIYWALQSNPHLWNANPQRTASPDSPHHGLDDIWARFGVPDRAMDGLPHEADWYPSAQELGVIPLCESVMSTVGGVAMGGVLITRIPPGKMCRPHVDHGWHAREYEKFAVQITSAPGQRFHFEGASLETRPGDLFWFDNQYLHWVTNDTPYERVTMIICIKKGG